MDENERSNASAWATVLALAPLLYVLSVGSVALCLKLTGASSPKSLEHIYTPLAWAIQHSKALGSLMDKHLDAHSPLHR